MTIPIAWGEGEGSFAAFFQKEVKEEKAVDEKFAVANAVALIGAVIVGSGVPEWLPELFGFLEDAANKVSQYEQVINGSCTAFWKVVGVRIIPEIEDYRYTFSGQYFS
jgi:hypothetical protein